MKDHAFIKQVEDMVDPIDVGTLHFMQTFTQAIPPQIQDKIIHKSANKTPYMGFVVEPYSFFLCYEIIDVPRAEALLPDGYQLIKTAIFAADEPKYYCIFGCFNVHASAFWGTRVECYVIAESIQTGLLSWVIVDYDTNTVSYDTKNGLSAGGTDRCVLTTNFHGDLIVDVQNKKKERALIVESSVTQGIYRALDQRLWLEGNLSVTYGRELSQNSGEAFSVMFHPEEVEQAWTIPLADTNIRVNTWFEGLLAAEPEQVVCFPFAQHFLSDSPGYFSNIQSKEELIAKREALDFDCVPRYSSRPLKRAFLIGQVISLVITISLLCALFLF